MPRPVMPYSVSMPMTLGIAIAPSSSSAPPTGRRRTAVRCRLQVLAGVHPFDLPALAAVGVAKQGANVHDPLALLPGDAGPVVRVRRVREVLVLLELVADGHLEVVEGQALLALGQEP